MSSESSNLINNKLHNLFKKSKKRPMNNNFSNQLLYVPQNQLLNNSCYTSSIIIVNNNNSHIDSHIDNDIEPIEIIDDVHHYNYSELNKLNKIKNQLFNFKKFLENFYLNIEEYIIYNDVDNDYSYLINDINNKIIYYYEQTNDYLEDDKDMLYEIYLSDIESYFLRIDKFIKKFLKNN